MSTLANQLVVVEREEVARGIRLLLAQPLITERGDPVAFEVVRRRKEPLAKWFDYTCGWSLVVEPRRGYARLLKVRPTADASRPALRPRAGRAPFDRRRYVLLCVTAAELTSVPMTTIGLLADRVVQAMAADPALAPFDTTSRRERMAFVDVLKLLESYGVLAVVDGLTESFVDTAEAKVLYRVDVTLLMRLPAAPVGPSRLALPAQEVPARFEELLAELMRERRYGTPPPATHPAQPEHLADAADAADAAYAGDTAFTAHPAQLAAGDEAFVVSDTRRNLWLRHSVLRRLFDDPVLYREDLTDDELAYLASPTGRQILRRAVEQAGLVLEERAEGYLLVDPDAVATDSTFPDDSSTARVAALLLLEGIADTPGGATPEQLAEAASALLRRFPRWAKAYQATEGAHRLADDAVAVLRDFGLARAIGDRVVPRPAAHRYRVAHTSTTTATATTEEGGPL
ncbi:TIGR02678 family protein [Streptomyces sp. yr375]|uniref:TIGR02678 family protein n=1 Tax=Streptomyces sp. yr375 TaxID=1761906 RepID=UPI0008D339A5|nr:TIGR02678 family protein [Streptomyces sp. yr375]SEQ71247.1 TIGR02678 family protein [Streptomyces sp. yr375]